MDSDVPYLPENSIRGIFYVGEINQELEQEKPATISQLAENSEWRSSYYTTLWKNLSPELVKRENDGQNTRLELTKQGREAYILYRKRVQLFGQAGL